MPTVVKPVKKTPAFVLRTSLDSEDKDAILKILNQKQASNDKKTAIIKELEVLLTAGRNHMQIQDAWPLNTNINSTLKPFLNSAKRFEIRLKDTIDGMHLRCALRNQGRRNVIDCIPNLNRAGIHEDLLELIYQIERAIEETQKDKKVNRGQKNKHLKEVRDSIQRDLEAKYYNKHIAPGLEDRDKACRKDFWKICKRYVEPKREQ